MSARELLESLLSPEAKQFMASVVVDHLDGVVGEVELEKAQAEAADSMWDLQ